MLGLEANELTYEKVLIDSILSFDESGFKEAVKGSLEAGTPVEKVIDSIVKGMDIVGERFEKGEYFLAELVMAGEILKSSLAGLKASLKSGEISSAGTIVIGTVQGDLHDIGKNILVPFLTSAGFNVIDLGVDVSGDDFVEAVRENNADIVAMSVLLSIYVPTIRDVVDALEKAGLRDQVGIIIGGGCTREYMVRELGVDAWAPTAIQGVKVCKEMMRERGKGKGCS